MATTQKWRGIIVLLVALLLGSAGLGHTSKGGHGGGGHGGKWHGGHGGKWHGGHHGWHKGHHGWHGGTRVGIGIGIGPFWGPYWAPRYAYPYAYPYAYAYPPVVAAPSTQLYIQPSSQAPVLPPPFYWYYCDASQGYYPYVQQCPGGWRTVTPTPP
jgi:hypothetical protein